MNTCYRTDALGGEALIAEDVRHDHQIDFVGEQLVAQRHAAVDVGLDDDAGVAGLDGADEAGQPGHGRQLGHADADVALQDFGALDLLDQFAQDPAVRKTLADQGCAPVGNTPADFKKIMDEEIDKWSKLVKLSGATVD